MGGLVVGTTLVLSALAIYLLGNELERGLQVRVDSAHATVAAAFQRRGDEAVRLARLLAADPALVDAVRRQDSAGLAARAAGLAHAAPEVLLLVTDPAGRPLAPASAPGSLADAGLLASAARGQPAAGLTKVDPCTVVAAASAPLLAGDQVAGIVVVAFPLDLAFLDELKSQADATIWLLCGSLEGSQVLGAANLQLDPAAAEIVLAQGHAFSGKSRVDGVLGYGEHVPLKDAAGRVIGMYGVMQPDQAVTLARQEVAGLFAVIALVFVVAVLAEAYLLARQITTPLASLTRATRALGEGRMDVPVDVPGQDELAVLARGFNTMRESLMASHAELSRERDRYRDLLAVVPHEFRTPLAALTASLELLQSDFADLTPDQARSLLQSIRRSTLRLHSLVDNLLDSASIQAGRFQVRPEPSDLAGIVHEAWLFVQPLLEQKGQELRLDVPPTLRPVMADGPRVAQVLINLLANAAKYGPPGVPLTLEAREQGDSVRVAVTDLGPGILAADQPRLFQRFARAASADSPAPPGLGLGLAIVKEIVDLHRGAIGLDSQPGLGTTVWFTLPLAPAVAPGVGPDGQT